jgi:hypothetical protein
VGEREADAPRLCGGWTEVLGRRHVTCVHLSARRLRRSAIAPSLLRNRDGEARVVGPSMRDGIRAVVRRSWRVGRCFDRPYSAETEPRLPAIAGGLSVALARTFKIFDSHLKNPGTEDRERAFQIFDRLL